MFWNKMLVSVILIMIFFVGCCDMPSHCDIPSLSDMTIRTFAKSLTPNKPLYLETVDNEEFKKFLLEKNLIKGLKENDILWVGNTGNRLYQGLVCSSKIIFTKQNIFLLTTPSSLFSEGLTKDNYQNYDYDIRDFSRLYDPSLAIPYKTTTKISEDKKLLIINRRPDWIAKFSPDIGIKSRYNDIEKIKSIIDERVAYFKKNPSKFVPANEVNFSDIRKNVKPYRSGESCNY